MGGFVINGLVGVHIAGTFGRQVGAALAKAMGYVTGSIYAALGRALGGDGVSDGPD